MCGRFSLIADDKDMAAFMGELLSEAFGPNMPPRYNIAPTQPIAIVTAGPSGQKEGLLARWGFVTSWVKDPKSFTLLINARSETAAEKPSFRNAMRHRRVLVPASGFYEWQRFGKGQKSQAYWVRPRDGSMVAFGGLLETWAGSDGSEVDTACIISTAANQSFSAIHHRLPLVVHPADFDQWLDCKTQEPRDIEHLLKPAPDDYFEAIPISDAVNKVSNSSPSIQDRITEEPRIATVDPADDQMSLF